VRQNLDTSAEEVGEERGRRVRLAWRAEDASPLGEGADTNEEDTDS
jgi:hypothetical protein